MRALVYPADNGGCGFYRMIWPGGFAERAGVDIHIGTAVAEAAKRGLPIGAMIVLEARQRKADVVVWQRPMRREWWHTIGILQQNGIATVVEIDDDFEHLPHHNIAYEQSDPLKDPEDNRDWLRKCCEIADMVTVSTPAIAKTYGGHGRVRVIRNRVHPAYLGLRGEKDGGTPVVLWTGVVAYHPYDLQVMGSALGTACERTGARFRSIGGSGEAARNTWMRTEVLPWLPLNGPEYAMEISRADIGIVPLELSPFNEAKSYIKGLEYAACGLPFVASPTPEYRYLAELGAGDLARTPREWRGILTRLITDEGYRKERADAAFEVAKNLTHQDGTPEWTEAWEAAIRMRQVRAA